MHESAINFQTDMRMSVQSILVIFYGWAFVVFTAGTLVNDMTSKIALSVFALVIAAASLGIGMLSSKLPTTSKWLSLLLIESILIAVTYWFGAVSFYAVAFLIPAFAAVLISLRASGVMAMVQSVLLILFHLLNRTSEPFLLIVALVSCWVIYGLLYAAYKPITEILEWAEQVYVSANETLEQLRDERANYEQTVAELKYANGQLNSLNKLAQNLRQIAEMERSAKTQFVANVSHELRTPLNMIAGYTEMITQSPHMYAVPLPGALLADLAVVQRNAEQLSRLVNDVLDMSQIESDQMALMREWVDFREVVAFMFTAVTPLFKRKNLFLRQEIQPDIQHIFCDRTRIQEVLLNILSNAGRFTEQGGVVVRASIEDENLLIAITDTGHGIAQTDINRLFKPFEQLDLHIRRDYGGSGLGLAISKKFIEMHEGRIWVESQVAVGTTFFIALPLIQPSPVATDPMRLFNPHLHYESRSKLGRNTNEALKPQLAVVETGDVLTRLITRYMSDIEVVSAASLAEFDQCRTELRTDIVLINQKIQALDSTALRQLAYDTGMVVITCSISDMDERAQSLGVDDILIKPISRERLLRSLAQRGIREGGVLIVDDEPDACQLFARMLGADDQNYRVLTANDGAEALQILTSFVPSVILLDLIMPKMNGFEFLVARAADEQLRRIPVIITSANDADFHPLSSKCLTITNKDDLSAGNLIQCVRAVMQILSATNDSSDPALRAVPPAS